MAKQLSRFILLSLVSVWMGGFTFYAAVVVPVGTRVLDSAMLQGMVTREVTHWLNLLGVAAVTGILVNAMTTKGAERKPSIALSLSLVATLVILCGLHYRMDQMLDIQNRIVLEQELFYRWHQFYLWTSILQWALTGGWLWHFCRRP